MTINPDFQAAVTLVSGLARVKVKLQHYVSMFFFKKINLAFANSEHVFEIER
jgi:hypothetical protein